MNSKIKINLSSQKPVYKQLIEEVQNLVSTGEYKDGEFIPSMNELSTELEISKETVKKAYSILREKGIIESSHGKGFYITNNGDSKIRILIVFDRISNYKQIIYSSFSANIMKNAEITIRLHNQDIDLFEHFIDENLDNFDYYLITPHFPLVTGMQKKVISILKKIPNRKLLLLDRQIEGLHGNYGCIYQDFEKDIVDGLKQGIDTLRNYKKLNVISMHGSLYAPLIEKGIKIFCDENQINFKVFKKYSPDIIQKNETYLILNSQLDYELIELVKMAKMKNYVIGKDIGIISYNESPVNEIILNGLTVLSTDFKQMGSLAAQMIQDKSLKKRKCDFQLIRRGTF